MKHIYKIIAEVDVLQSILNYTEEKDIDCFYNCDVLYIVTDKTLSAFDKELRKIDKNGNMYMTEVNDNNIDRQPDYIQQHYKQLQIDNDLKQFEQEQQERMQQVKTKLLNLQRLIEKEVK